jgi:hypothetical protein
MATTAKTKTRSKAAAKPPSRKIEDKAQYERFRQFAREHETDDDPETFDRAARRVVLRAQTDKPKEA